MPVSTRSGVRRAARAGSWSGSQLSQLPTELVEEVLRFLSAQDVVAAALSSKYVFHAAFCDRIWHDAFRRTFPELIEIFEACPPRWWKRASWYRRYRRVSQGAVFSAQVLNREAENASEDFMLSAYDAKLCIERPSLQASPPTFIAKYLPMGSERVTEKRIAAERLRPVPRGATAYAVYPTQCHDWEAGDPVELQWKAHPDHPYGWWLGKVQEVHPDRLVLLFQQYPGHSPWRNIVVPLDHSPLAPSNWHPAYGYVGGAHKVQPAEHQQWLKFHKKALQRDVGRAATDGAAAAAAADAAAPAAPAAADGAGGGGGAAAAGIGGGGAEGPPAAAAAAAGVVAAPAALAPPAAAAPGPPQAAVLGMPAGA